MKKKKNRGCCLLCLGNSSLLYSITHLSYHCVWVTTSLCFNWGKLIFLIRHFLSVSYLFVILVFCYVCEDLWKLSALNLHSHLVGLPGKCVRIRMPPNSFQMAWIFVCCFEEMKHGIIQSYPISVIIHFTRIYLLCWYVASLVFQLSGRHGFISFAI